MSFFFDRHTFPFLKLLEDHYEAILEEASKLHQEHLVAYPLTDFYNHGWWVCGLYAVEYPGMKAEQVEPMLARNRTLCPVSTRVAQQLPGNQMAGFSILAPGCVMDSHTHEHGYHIAHLGLVIPEGCGIEVGGEIRVWNPGHCFAFDEKIAHHAWNHGNQRRVVFLADFDPPI